MPTTIKPNAAPVKYLRVETANPETRVTAAGHDWAGISEVPADTLTAAQLELLRADKRLQVSDAEARPA